MGDPRQQLGLRGEELVAAWLVSRGWQVLARRWRSPHGELDLVCLDPGGCLVAVEVKLRRGGRAGTGEESVDRRRIARLRQALAAFARSERPGATALRLDLVAVTPAASAWRMRRTAGIDGW
jgi:putative endonuclease